MIKLTLKSFNGMNKHYIPELEKTLDEFIQENGFLIGDEVKIENEEECVLPLGKGSYCLIFSKDGLFIEEPFSKAECKELFGKDFNY